MDYTCFEANCSFVRCRVCANNENTASPRETSRLDLWHVWILWLHCISIYILNSLREHSEATSCPIVRLKVGNVNGILRRFNRYARCRIESQLNDLLINMLIREGGLKGKDLLRFLRCSSSTHVGEQRWRFIRSLVGSTYQTNWFVDRSACQGPHEIGSVVWIGVIWPKIFSKPVINDLQQFTRLV